MVGVDISAGLLLDFKELVFTYRRRGFIGRPERVLHDGSVSGFLCRDSRLIFFRVAEEIKFKRLRWAVNILVLFFGSGEIRSIHFRHRIAKFYVASDFSFRRIVFETFGTVDRDVGHRHVAELLL